VDTGTLRLRGSYRRRLLRRCAGHAEYVHAVAGPEHKVLHDPRRPSRGTVQSAGVRRDS